MKLDMQQLMKRAQAVQAEMEKKQKELADTMFKASVGGGMVTATVNGRHEVLSLTIDPSIITAGDSEMLQDLIIAAVNEGIRQANNATQAQMQGMLGGVGGLGNLFGG